MVAVHNRAESPLSDRVELSWVSSLGCVRSRIVLQDGRLWIDARALASGLLDPFSSLGVQFETGMLTAVYIEPSGVLVAADEVTDEAAVESLMEMFCLVAAAKGLVK
jgi:hypothetical protein